MKILVLFTLLITTAFSQVPNSGEMQVTFQTDSLGLPVDSFFVWKLPAGAVLTGITIKADTALNGHDTTPDSVKIGIGGELAANIIPYRFLDTDTSSLTTGAVLQGSHFQTRQCIRGNLYTYSDGGGDEITVVCTDADTPYPIAGLVKSSNTNMDTVATGDTLLVGHYQGGEYSGSIGQSFSASRVNSTAHLELQINGVDVLNVASERKITSANQVGAAAMPDGMFTLYPGDKVCCIAESDLSTNTIMLPHFGWSIEKQHDPAKYQSDGDRQIWLYTGCTKGSITVRIKYELNQ